MKAEELRIGNLIIRHGYEMSIYQIEKRFKKVYTVNSLDVDFDDVGEIEKLCSPITLTENILRNLLSWDFVGFDTRITYKHMKFHAIKIEMRTDRVMVYFNDKLISCKRYMHELQNLFFALTNEELKLK